MERNNISLQPSAFSHLPMERNNISLQPSAFSHLTDIHQTSGKLDLFGRFQYKITKNQAFLQ